MYDRDPDVDSAEIGINMTIPLYNSGESRAKIRQSKYLKWQAQEQVLEAERKAVADVTSAWEYMVANRAKIKSIKDQVKANEIALDGVQKEEALGNRTILDVLDAYQELLNSNVEEVKARRNYYVSGMNVLMAMGKLTAEDLKLNVDIYNPKNIIKKHVINGYLCQLKNNYIIFGGKLWLKNLMKTCLWMISCPQSAIF